MHKRTGRRYRSGRATAHYDVIVIGSGMGGLSNAGLLSRLGKKVCVLEQHYTAGGMTHCFEREGYEWDIGLHYVGEVHKKYYPTRLLFDAITNGKLEWEPMHEVYDRVVLGDKQYDFVRGQKNLKANLKRYFPDDAKAIDHYISLVRKIALLTPVFLAGKGMPPALARQYDRLRGLIFPKEMHMTTQQVLSRITGNQELIGVLSAHWSDYGVSPEESPFFIHAMVVNHFFDGGNFPIGGAARIAELVIPVIQSAGGEVFTYAKVMEIVIENNKATGVRLENGDVIHADQVVSACDVRTTIETLLPAATRAQFGYSEKLEPLAASGCNFTLYMGVKGSKQELGITGTNLWIYPSADHHGNIQKSKANFDHEFPMMFFSFPSAKDPEWQREHPDRTTVELVVPALYDMVGKWEDTTWGQRGEDYLQFKEKMTERLLSAVYKYMPQLEGHVDFYELSTPLSTTWFQNNRYGETFGLEHTPSRYEQSWLHPQTPVKGLYLTGQDVFIGNVSGALLGGAMTTLVMLGHRADKLFRMLLNRKYR